MCEGRQESLFAYIGLPMLVGDLQSPKLWTAGLQILRERNTTGLRIFMILGKIGIVV